MAILACGLWFEGYHLGSGNHKMSPENDVIFDFLSATTHSTPWGKTPKDPVV